MTIIVGTLLALVSIAVIAYPFFGRDKYRLTLKSAITREKLRAERLRIYRKISDIEADFAAGYLTEADYRQNRDQLRISAAKILRQESEAEVIDSKRDEELEREISRLREQTAQTPEGGDIL